MVSPSLSFGISMEFEALRRADEEEAVKAKITVMSSIIFLTNASKRKVLGLQSASHS